MKHKHSSNFPNHKNLMDMFKHITPFLEIKFIAFDYLAWIINCERYFTFWNIVLLLNIIAMQTLSSFPPGQQTLKQNHIQSKWTKRAVLGTSPDAMFPHINEWEAVNNSFRYQSWSTTPGDKSWRSDTKPMQQHLCPLLQSTTV